MRCGASKNIVACPVAQIAASSRSRATGPGSRKPTNRKPSSGSGQTERAAVTALGPGTGNTATSRSRHALTRRKPGSEISGVPASETSATCSPASRRFNTRAAARDSLSSRIETRRGRRIFRCANSAAVRLVSSEAIVSTVARTSAARRVTSPRFPIGVATTYRHPGMCFPERKTSPGAKYPVSRRAAIRPRGDLNCIRHQIATADDNALA